MQLKDNTILTIFWWGAGGVASNLPKGENSGCACVVTIQLFSSVFHKHLSLTSTNIRTVKQLPSFFSISITHPLHFALNSFFIHKFLSPTEKELPTAPKHVPAMHLSNVSVVFDDYSHAASFRPVFQTTGRKKRFRQKGHLIFNCSKYRLKGPKKERQISNSPCVARS